MTGQLSADRPAARPATEAHFLLLAVAAWTGASVAPVSAYGRGILLLAVVALIVALLIRSPYLLAVAVLAVTSHQGARADVAYVPMDVGLVADHATVVGDPQAQGFGSVVELKLRSGDRVEAVGYGAVGFELQKRVVGDRLFVRGSNRPVGDRPWLKARHITGRVAVDSVEFRAGPAMAQRIPERARSLIEGGASTMSERERGLYLGLVIGDDRLQTPGQQIKFRAAGLSHLLAVSGQNVAFVVAVARPLLLLLGYRARFGAVIAILILFAIVTRAEPSVLRATATAMIAAWASFSGRERSGVQMLALAVVVLVCIDPFLVDSVAFQLSVMASFGILTVGPVIQSRLPGPGWFVEPLSITLSAQAGVSPLLLMYFGPISLASVPANLFAGWAAAATMTLGLTVGVVSGLVPGWLATALQWPSRALLWWIETVASVAASAPSPQLGFVEVGSAVALVLIVIKARSAPLRLVVLGLIAAMLYWALPTSPSHHGPCGRGIAWYPSSELIDRSSQSVLVVGGDARTSSVANCFDAGIRQVDTVVATSGNANAATIVTAATEVFSVERILAPPQHRIIGGRRQLTNTTLVTADHLLEVAPSGNGGRLLVVEESYVRR